jgi:mono/diheme cytochrome c family protein
MRSRFMRGVAILIALAASLPALAGEDAITLKDGAGRDALLNNCTACHSLDYVQTNSPFPTQKVWDAEVTKMIKVFGAPISDADAKIIVDYLAKNYGS